jgi:hypothetical protein
MRTVILPCALAIGVTGAGCETKVDVGAIAGDGGAQSSELLTTTAGSLCNGSSQVVTGTKITADLTWPKSTATVGGAAKASIWLLSRYTVDGASGAITGTVQTCGMQTPAVTLSATASFDEGLPSGQSASIQISIPASSWDGTPSTAITGQQGGLKAGSTFAIDPVVTLYGLTPTSILANGAQPWPTQASGLPASEIAYADGGVYSGLDLPGILAVPLSTPPGYLLTTSLTPTSPTADQIFLAMRTQLSLHGTLVSCAQQTGTAVVTELDSRIVGCHIGDGGTCTTSEYSFLDTNLPQFVPVGATFDAKSLMQSAQCSDVLAALP